MEYEYEYGISCLFDVVIKQIIVLPVARKLSY